MRLHFAVLALLCLGSFFLSGCAWKKDLDDARLQADELRLQLNALRQQQADEDVGRLRAQHDRLVAENRMLSDEIARLREKQTELEARLADAEKNGPELARQLAAQRKELETAIVNTKQSRQQWEDTLAERQRQIEILSSRIERLQQDLAALRHVNRPASQANGAKSAPSRP